MVSETSSSPGSTSRSRHLALKTTGGVFGVLALGILILVMIWQWDWFVPLINRKASDALHRPVSIAHLHVSPGLRTSVTVDDLKISQPEGFERKSRFRVCKIPDSQSRCLALSDGTWAFYTRHSDGYAKGRCHFPDKWPEQLYLRRHD